MAESESSASRSLPSQRLCPGCDQLVDTAGATCPACGARLIEVPVDPLIGKVVDGTIKPQNYLLGFNENGLGLAPYGKFEDKISAADKAKITQLIADIKAGKVTDLPKLR